jgi:hypothetical protein
MYMAFAIIGTGDEIAILSAIGGIFVVVTCLCLFMLRKYRKADQSFMIDYLNIGIHRYILALFMIMYGADKLFGNFFDYQLFALDSKLNDVSEFQLAWFFYGKNRWQELFTGIMEFVPALFLFSRRSYYVAAIILLPVTAQVFILNFFFKIGGVTFPASTVLLACNSYIIYSQREKIVAFFRSLDFTIAGTLTGPSKTVIKVLRGIAIFLACFFIFVKVRPVFFKSAHQKKYQGLVGVYTLKEMKKNGIAYSPAVTDSNYYKDLYVEKQARWNILRRFDNQTEAFILRINTRNDSISLCINKGGIGDGPDVIDSATALKGVYTLTGKSLTIRGFQSNDTLELIYGKQDALKPKNWFW